MLLFRFQVSSYEAGLLSVLHSTWGSPLASDIITISLPVEQKSLIMSSLSSASSITFSLKDLISSPLEAGPSLLDAHHLPPSLAPALEYVSHKLAKKAIHTTLVVVRRDYQLPSVVPPMGSPGLATPVTPSFTPSSPRFGFANRSVSALKGFVRAGSLNKPVRLNVETQGSPMTPMYGTPLSATGRWPMSPMTPLSPPPMTPCTSVSSATDASGQISSSSFGLRLIHPAGLPMRDERELRTALLKAERKFGIGSEWLSPALSPAACGLTNELIHKSIVQNEALFSSEGLTLLALDGLYSLKAALSAYSRTKSSLRLEDAVDELRRLVLAGNGRKVLKTDLLRSYDWLSVSHGAIKDLDKMYKRAYGGPEEIGAISGMASGRRAHAVAEPAIRTEPDVRGTQESGYEPDEELEQSKIGIAITKDLEMPIVKPIFRPIARPIAKAPSPPKKVPSPKAPLLKLQTNFEPPRPKSSNPEPKSEFEEDEDEDLTARPKDNEIPLMLQPWSCSIDEVMTAGVLSPGARNSMKLGPRTPNGYEDISPTTRGEWGFLMVDDKFERARTVAVETC